MIGCLTELSSVVLFLKLKLNGKLTMSTANPNENLLLEALRGWLVSIENRLSALERHDDKRLDSIEQTLAELEILTGCRDE
jgi:hypothetical protein